MKRLKQFTFLACGWLLMLAANSVFAQGEQAVEINRKPLQDLGHLINEKFETRTLKGFKPFLIQLVGVLNKDGKLDPKKSRYIKSEGDEMTMNIAKNFVEAVNDAGFLMYLKRLDVEKLNLTFSQDEADVKGIINVELPTAEKAKTVASALKIVFAAANIRNDKDSVKVLVENWQTETEGKNVSVKFTASNSVIQDLILSELKKLNENKVLNQ